MKKSILVIGMALVLMLAVVGCGNQTAEAPAQAPAAQAPAQEEVTTAAQAPAEQTPAQDPAAQAPAAGITQDEAKAIALKDAGFTEDQVQITKLGKDLDDGIEKYEVEFVQGETEYNYDIDPQTGNIISREQESIYD